MLSQIINRTFPNFFKALTVAGTFFWHSVAQCELPKSDVASTLSAAPHIYLFLNEKDQDEACSVIYETFDSYTKKLPEEIIIRKVALGTDSELYRQFKVIVVPSVLFVDRDGIVKERVEGEGSAVLDRLKALFSQAHIILGVK